MAQPRRTFRKKITDPKITKCINVYNMSLMEKFLSNLSIKRSPKTVFVYRSNLIIFFTWNLRKNGDKFFCDLKKFEIVDFFNYAVAEMRWSPNRFAQMHSTLSSFSTWIETVYDDEYPDFKNLLPKIEKPFKEPVRKKSIFKKEELDTLMKWLGFMEKPHQQCLLALAMASGARISELARFTTTMIDEEHTAFDGLFLETTEEMQVKGRGTRGKHIVRYIIKDLFLPYYKAWLPVRNKIMKKNGKKHDYVFIKSNGDPATQQTFRGWMAKWDNVLNKHFYPHSMRHFWTSYLLKVGVEKELVQELQAWSSDTLVDLYNDNTAKDRKWKGLDKLREALAKDRDIKT